MLYPVIRSSCRVAFLVLLVTIPITGIVLDGYGFDTHILRPLVISAIVFLFNLIKELVQPYISKPKNFVPVISLAKSRILYSLVAAGLIMAVPFMGGSFLTNINFALLYVLLGLGLNIVVGLAGLLDLGFVAFYAVGAYTYALGQQYWGISFWAAIPMAMAFAGFCGMILAFPVLRMHGDYLAIVTLGFGEIINLILVNWVEFTNGPNGVDALPPTFFGIEFGSWSRQGGPLFHELLGLEYNPTFGKIFIYCCLVAIVALTIFICHRLKNSPSGRAWEALKEDEIACRSLGINHVTVKLSAFALGATIAGLAGVFFAGIQELVNPDSFTFFESAIILAIVVLGGMGSLPGVILAALCLRLLPEFLRDFQEYRVLIFGALMVITMIWRPSGLIKSKRPHYDLRKSAS